jgi:hypothetical protein
MTELAHLLADYVLCLAKSAETTHQATDRPLYQSYLADAAQLLALATNGATPSELALPISRHERLLSQTFLAGPEHKAVLSHWGKVSSLK